MSRNSVPAQFRVIHDCARWLPLTQNWIYETVRRLPDRASSVVLCTETENSEDFAGPRIICPYEESWPVAVRRVVFESVRRRRMCGRRIAALSALDADSLPTVVHSHFGTQAWQALPDLRALGIPQVVGFYGFDATFLPDSNPEWIDRYAELFDYVSAVIAEGPNMADTIVNLGCPREKVHVIHLGAATEEISFQPRVWNGDGPLRVLMAAAFREKKGLSYGVRAVGALKDKVPIELTIVGDAGEDQEKQRILRAIRDTGLESHTALPGFMSFDALMQTASQHHVFLAPSVTADNGDSEGGLPYTLAVMAASGIACIGSRHADIPELIRHGETGMLADEHDVEGLAAAITELIDDRNRWDSILKAARAHVESEFDAWHTAESWAAVYAGCF